MASATKLTFGWFGDGGLGDRLIQDILAGRKRSFSCPAYDAEDAQLKAGDKIEVADKRGRSHGEVIVTNIEIRLYGSFDEELARSNGKTLAELRELTRFANGREPSPNEEMRVIYFQLVSHHKAKL